MYTIISLLLACIFLGLKNPTTFIVLYVIVTTEFLGFFDTSSQLVDGHDLIMVTINFSALLVSILTFDSLRVQRQAFIFLIVLILLLAWGIAAPVILFGQSFFETIIASKQFFYFAIFVYILANCRRVNVAYITRFIKFLGLYLSSVYLLFFFTGIGPGTYVLEESVYGPGIRVFSPMYISLAIVVFGSDWLEGRISSLAFSVAEIVLIFGLSISGYLSLTITNLIIVGFFLTLNRKRMRFSFGKVLVLLLISSFFIGLSIVSSDALRSAVLSKAKGVFDGSDGALLSRDIYNGFRWDAIKERPVLGYGFIHKSSSINRELGANPDNRFMESLSVIDSGYVDLFGKFGYLGTSLFLLVFSGYVYLSFFKSTCRRMLGYTIGAFLLQYYLVNYTWSVFTFAPGIISLSIAVLLLNYARGNQKPFNSFAIRNS